LLILASAIVQGGTPMGTSFKVAH